MYRNAGFARPQAHTIQAKANFVTIIQDNVDRMVIEFRNITKKQVNNLLVLPIALNWDHMKDISNLISHSFCMNVIVSLVENMVFCDTVQNDKKYSM